ncbi:M24 family metallopeptidase [Clostridium weizhouense]|uniref:Xaa-Pro peptidase family protein n=1 Tax=Clostridium weizhouense TaxID=2859781 RepID=A0ABS7AR39_9CLOT|nr:Xaa-Pro peptidase family protein [Clostridium weizhouense]MBW6411134.1 Xaa-Pro peptidase family protein [Clostridium weizhouense]
MKNSRVLKVIEEMELQGLSQIIVTSPASIYYLTGKWIEAGERMVALYLTSSGNHKLIVNKLFPVENNLGIDIVWYTDSDDSVEILSKILENNKILGIDKDWSAKFLIRLMELNVVKGFVNSSPIIDSLRMIKDAEEIDLMRKSSQINDRVMLKLQSELKEGMTEKYAQRLLAEIYEQEGASDFSFTPIIAFDTNGADPHSNCGDTKLKKGDTVVLDIGGLYNHYCSDMTRTVFFGEEPNNHKKEIYEIVKQANLNGIKKVKDGVKFSEIDSAARSYIESKGYGEFFTHRTGHSIGLETHDKGDVSSINHDEVKAGMIFSIEPGIYLKDDIGVRIEDLVLVTKDGAEILNAVTKDLIVI